jgi:putative DNA primase/helicase
VGCSEVNKFAVLDIDLVKRITGGDRLTGRHLNKGIIEFTPQFTLFLVANNTLRVHVEDAAVWNRIQRVHLEKSIPKAEQVPLMQEHLKTDQRNKEAMLAWIVEGWKRYRQEGMVNRPAVVEMATDAWRVEQNPLTEWLEECGEFNNGSWTSSQNLYKSYVNWLQDREAKDQKIGRIAFGAILAGTPGIKSHKQDNTRGYTGVALNTRGTRLLYSGVDHMRETAERIEKAIQHLIPEDEKEIGF